MAVSARTQDDESKAAPKIIEMDFNLSPTARYMWCQNRTQFCRTERETCFSDTEEYASDHPQQSGHNQQHKGVAPSKDYRLAIGIERCADS